MAFSIFGFKFGASNRAEVPINTSTQIIQFGRKSKVLDLDFHKWYRENPFVFWAVEERNKAVSNANFYFLVNGERTQNEVTEKLNAPNKWQSKQDFLRQDLTYQSLFGTGYWYINKLRPSKTFFESDLLNIDASKLEFLNSQGQEIKDDYIYNTLRFQNEDIRIYFKNHLGNKVELNKELLLPFFDTSTFTNPYYSKSRLESLLYVVSNSQAALESQNTFLSNPGGIGAWVSRKKNDTLGSTPLTEIERSSVERDLQNEYGTLDGQKNIQLIGHDMDYISTIPKISDLKLNETLQQMGVFIFGTFGLPKELFSGLLEGSTFENQKEAYKRFLETEAQNTIDNRVNSLNTYLGYTGENRLIASFDHLPVFQENEKERAEVNKINAESIEKEKAVWDDWLNRNLVTEQQYKQKFEL
jgi:hypothetical protein